MPKGHGIGGWSKKRVVVRKNERDLPEWSFVNEITSWYYRPNIPQPYNSSVCISVCLSNLCVVK
jgi:hypothetical protein